MIEKSWIQLVIKRWIAKISKYLQHPIWLFFLILSRSHLRYFRWIIFCNVQHFRIEYFYLKYSQFGLMDSYYYENVQNIYKTLRSKYNPMKTFEWIKYEWRSITLLLIERKIKVKISLIKFILMNRMILFL